MGTPPTSVSTGGASASGSGSGSTSDPKLELYKLEYERAAIRYNDIYVAIWQIFSYMSVIAGGILTFGGDHFHKNLLLFLVSLPLVFWFWAVFLPHDRYGENCLASLRRMEADINSCYGIHLAHYSDFRKEKEGGDGTEGDRSGAPPKKWKKLGRVKVLVRAVFVILTLFWIYEAGMAWEAHKRTKMILEKPTEVKIISVCPDELKRLLDKTNEAQAKPQ